MVSQDLLTDESTWIVAAIALVLSLSAEWLHSRRVKSLANLAFGPRKKPSVWVASVPWLRGLSFAALAWGLMTLWVLPPKQFVVGDGVEPEIQDLKHVLMVLDVSPSMRLEDAGPEQAQSRMHRARDVMDSFFKRVPVHEYRISVVAVYSGAKPVVIDTRDIDVIRNILGDLPMHYAFNVGKTQLLQGLKEAAKIAKPWNPNSTTLIVVSDGDTVPATGMPKMPASIADVLIVGVGDPINGKFIDGSQSRQDVSTLRQIAARLGGVFHNGNEKHLSSALLAELTASEGESPLAKLGRREYALIACGFGGALLAFLPFLLHYLGTRWRPGVPPSRRRTPEPRIRSDRSENNPGLSSVTSRPRSGTPV